MTSTDAETLVDGLTFPEGVRWHDGALWFSDMHAARVQRLDPGAEPVTVAAVPECPSGLGFLPDGRPLVVSMHDRRLLRIEADGVAEHADLSALAPWHCNDMWVDEQGRAYVGNFGDGSAPPDPPTPTVLILVEPDGAARVVADDLWFPNGIVVSADGSTLIVAETRSVPGRLTAFSIAADGGLSERRTLTAVRRRRDAGRDRDRRRGRDLGGDAVRRRDRPRRRRRRGRRADPLPQPLRGGDRRRGRPRPLRLHRPELGPRGGGGAARRLRPAPAHMSRGQLRPRLQVGLDNFGDFLPADRWPQFLEIAAAADEAGVDSIAVVDHVVLGGDLSAPTPTGPSPAAARPPGWSR